jgi:hypothetical protein
VVDWEYLIVTFDWYRDRPRYANDHEIAGWDRRPLETLLAEWRAQGWDLVEAAPPRRGRFLLFRRPKDAQLGPPLHPLDGTAHP